VLLEAERILWAAVLAQAVEDMRGSGISKDSAEKLLRFFSFLWPLADEPELVAGVHLPFDDFSGLDVDGGGQRERQVHIALGDGFFTSDGLDLGRIVHIFF
jgi:hypothetical protein